LRREMWVSRIWAMGVGEGMVAVAAAGRSAMSCRQCGVCRLLFCWGWSKKRPP